MSDIFVRAYTDNNTNQNNKIKEHHNRNFILTIDTETTTDEYQNLTFGSCLIRTKISTGFKEEWYLFYGDIPQDKISLITEYGKENSITVIPVMDFVNNIFYPYAFIKRAEVIGFNLPFDLSRLAISSGLARKIKDAFSFKLSEDKRNPRMRIKSIDQKRSFISFTKPSTKNSDKKYKPYSGYFLDLKTLTFALTDKSYSLDSACKDFGAERKKHVEEHGKITTEYIEYNIQDVKSTADLYLKALERYRMFNLTELVNKLYSPASIGKAYLRKMGIRSFNDCNPDFPKDVLGFTMSSYYGGRTENRVKDKAIPVTYLDFTSMYPTVYSLLGLDNFLKAKKINVRDNTNSVKKFLENITIEDLCKPELWLRNEMHSIVQVRPYEDIFPVRTEYHKQAKNIGINYLTSSKPLWYTVQDVISSKILSGKMPEVIQAYSFYPSGIQDGLKDVNISDITITQNDDFIRKLIEKRIETKKSNRPEKDQIQLILKIIANATSYGIYIEQNPEDNDSKQNTDVYSTEHFHTTSIKTEPQGRYFNPIMATLITASSRLILAISESIAVSKGYFAYCDTDSVFVNPAIAQDLQDFFRLLNPYSTPVEMFKIETDDDKQPLDDIMFYGISAKRYCLYRILNDEIKIVKYSTHGLGHLKDIDGKQIWEDILTKNFIEYNDKIAVSQITITKPSILNRFRKMNEGKPFDKQIKPFNFLLVGPERNDVIPSLPYTKNTKGIQYREFIDYRTGKSSTSLPLPSKEYWKSLEDVLTAYVRHNDSKFDYVNGIAKRKHITVDRIRYIGKESNNLEESLVTGIDDDSYLEYENLEEFKKWILALKPKDVKDKDISERGLRNFKQKIREGKGLKNKSKIVSALNDYFNSLNLTDKTSGP